jgi:carbon storage regulator
MLVLTRKSNQSIMIGDEIEISVLSVMGDKVRIGIQAPRSIPVYRREVYVAIQREREDELVAAETELIVPETELIATDAELITGDEELIAADTSAREPSSVERP